MGIRWESKYLNLGLLPTRITIRIPDGRWGDDKAINLNWLPAWKVKYREESKGLKTDCVCDGWTGTSDFGNWVWPE